MAYPPNDQIKNKNRFSSFQNSFTFILEETHHMYNKLARQAVEHLVKYDQFMPVPGTLSSELLRQRSCFITIFEKPGHKIIAHFGTLMPQHSNLAEEIVANASQAVISHSIKRVRRPDLPHLAYLVAIASPPQRIGDLSHLDPNIFGLYLTTDRGKSVIIMPHRAGIETSEDQFATALREGDINPREEAVTMYRFTVEYENSAT
jgi:AMMECR1 domain-containing protein